MKKFAEPKKAQKTEEPAHFAEKADRAMSESAAAAPDEGKSVPVYRVVGEIFNSYIIIIDFIILE